MEFAEILTAIRELDAKLSRDLHTGLAGVNASIAALTEMHHRALLEQERRNADFATRDRVEKVADRVHEHGSAIMARDLRIATNETTLADLAARLDQLAIRQSDRTVALLTTGQGYLVMAIITIGASLLAFILNHLLPAAR